MEAERRSLSQSDIHRRAQVEKCRDKEEAGKAKITANNGLEPAKRAHVFQHVRVVPVHTGTLWTDTRHTPHRTPHHNTT